MRGGCDDCIDILVDGRWNCCRFGFGIGNCVDWYGWDLGNCVDILVDSCFRELEVRDLH